jgi:hypothetical protein
MKPKLNLAKIALSYLIHGNYEYVSLYDVNELLSNYRGGRMKIEEHPELGHSLRWLGSTSISPGGIVIGFSDLSDKFSAFSKDQSRESIPVGYGNHVVNVFGSFVNHSCTPNTYVGTLPHVDGSCLISNSCIRAGDWITFNYFENEPQPMTFKYPCTCGLHNLE